MNFGLLICHPFFSSSEGLILLGQYDLWEDYEIINIRVGLLTLSLRNNAILVDFIRTGIFRLSSLFIINLAGGNHLEMGREAVAGGGGGVAQRHVLRCLWAYTVKKAVELLDAPSKNTFLKSNKYDSIVEIVYLDTHVLFSPLCNRMRKFEIREVQ